MEHGHDEKQLEGVCDSGNVAGKESTDIWAGSGYTFFVSLPHSFIFFLFSFTILQLFLSFFNFFSFLSMLKINKK